MTSIKALLREAKKIKDPDLREKTIEILKNPSIDEKLRLGDHTPLSIAPASKRGHHSYPMGLIQHTLSCVKLALALCDSIEKVYGGKVNRDIVIASALLHDIYKFYSYQESDQGYMSSKLGERLDHLSLAIGELYRRSFPLEVIHAVVAHHGKSSPITPRTIEALVVHLADKIDSELSAEILDAAKAIVRECLGEDVKMFKDGRQAFQIVLLKQVGGCEKLREEWHKLKVT
ncbi:MAG: dihydroneopterin 2',3'-cyclic phosphate phosphodiesterase [Candidatus Methanomethylicota archaeon]|uniref:Dihydroneopterin 2',3'-cyclic phosphate phosphodiesterase n=1 Tax=Thermoproteota archaeon TaxID=2056631 RepID=A0A497ESU2_9CREN|nr:MAG: dihydroneopterin 2',3'-cyclic phosphate phosphodiesterase [Candidatus Verstraetearchaeota archaeon]